MKAPIKIDQRNAGDYLASVATLCLESDADFFVLLHGDDKIENDAELGLTLTRKGKTYTQDTEMNTFNGMLFDEHTMESNPETILAKLIEA